MTQLKMFDETPEPPAYRPDPEKVRAPLRKILGEARAAVTMPWEPTRVSLYRKIVVPDLTRWLPEGEAATWRAEFEAQMSRLMAEGIEPL